MTATPRDKIKVTIWINEQYGEVRWGIELAGKSLVDGYVHRSTKAAEKQARRWCKKAGFEVKQVVTG